MAKVLVVRNIGGFGDLMTLSTGLDAMQRAGDNVAISLQPKWHPLFECWEGLRVIVPDAVPQEPADYVYDLVNPCPAGYAEHRWHKMTRMTTGKALVPEDRCSLFWRSLGLPPHDCPRVPVIKLGQKHREYAAGIVRGMQRPLVYLQTDAAEEYKMWPYFDSLCRSLTQRGASLVVRGSGDRPPYAKAIAVSGGILQGLALLAACDLVITTDSMALHAAAAAGRPCVLIAGPLGMEPRIAHYPFASGIKLLLDCSPCWRNAHIPCLRGQSNISYCMTHLTAAHVEQHVMRRLQEAEGGRLQPAIKYERAAVR